MKTLTDIESWKLRKLIDLNNEWSRLDSHEDDPRFAAFRSIDILEMEMIEVQLKVLLRY